MKPLYTHPESRASMTGRHEPPPPVVRVKRIIHSDDGYGSTPEYAVLAEMTDGTYECRTQHKDNGLVTDARTFSDRAEAERMWAARKTTTIGKTVYVIWPWTE